LLKKIFLVGFKSQQESGGFHYPKFVNLPSQKELEGEISHVN